MLENVNPDLSDSEFIEQDEPLDAPTPAISDFDAPTPGGEAMEEVEEQPEDDDAEDTGEGIDEELAAELDLALGDEDQPEADEDEDDEDDESEEEDDEDEDEEDSQAKKLLNEEIRDLEAAVAKKTSEVASSVNPLIRRRFEETLKKGLLLSITELVFVFRRWKTGWITGDAVRSGSGFGFGVGVGFGFGLGCDRYA